jgi:hypothetical protein
MTWFNNIQKRWPLRDFVFPITNTSLYQTRLAVFQSELYILLFHPIDVHTPSPKIEEYIEFPKLPNIKKSLEKFLSLEFGA